MTDLTKKEILMNLKRMQFTSREIETALEKSIEHWKKDILNRLEKDKIDLMQKDDSQSLCWKSNNERVVCFASCCPLCQLFLIKTIDGNCMHCPYTLFHDYTCNSNRSGWRKFVKDPCKETAKQMVKELKDALKFWKKLMA
jgi:hypothetical protein